MLTQPTTVTPAQAGAYTLWPFGARATVDTRLKTIVRIGPGLRRGDGNVAEARG